jgi:hypothetical protein
MNIPALILQLSHIIKQVFWVNYSPGVYFFRLNDLTYSDYDAIFTSGLVANDLEFVISVTFDNIILSEVSSIVNCRALQSSSYCSTEELWIHSPLDADPYNHSVGVGSAFQIRKGGANDGELWHMEDRLLSVPNISKSISDIYNSKIIFSGGDVEINNFDGKYDTLLEDEEIIGNKSNLLIKHPETGELIKMFSGFVEGGELGIEKLSLSIKDDKESLNIPIPQNVFTLATYPYLDPKNIDKPIPLAFGKCKNVELVCINELEPAAAIYNFLCADTDLGKIHNVTTVYVEGAPVMFGFTPASNTVQIATAYYNPGQKVTADIEGYEDSTGALMRNACDILKKLLIYFCGFSDTSDFFDIWDTTNAYNIYVYINEIKKFWEVIEEICKSSFLNFILNNNGSYSAFVNSYAEDYIREIRNYELIQIGSVNYNSNKLLSSVLIRYDLDHSENEWLQKKINTGETAFFEKYNQYCHKELETNLDNSTDAAAYGAAVLDYFFDAYKPVKIKTDYLEARDFILGKNYKIILSRPRAPELGTYKVKLIHIIENPNTFQTECTFQLIEKLADDNEMLYFGNCENALSPSLMSDGSIDGPFYDATWERTNLKKHTGSYSRVLTNVHATESAVVGLQDTSGTMHGLLQGVLYTLELWALTTAANPYHSYIHFEWYSSGGYFGKWLPCRRFNEWHKLSCTLLFDASIIETYFWIVTEGDAGIGTKFYIDDISIKYERK